MKARVIIVTLVLSASIFVVTCKDRGVDNDKDDERPNTRTFGKYYEPYELNIKPNAPGYSLPLDLNDIVNKGKISQEIEFDNILDLIRQNGFAIMEPALFSPFSGGDFVGIYENFGLFGIIPFVTSDTGLYLYRALFDHILKGIEEHEFIPKINDLTIALLNDAKQQYEQLEGDLKEAAKRNVAYLSVAQKLIDTNSSIPELVYDIVFNELAKIEAHSGYSKSDIFKYNEDYSQYVPRGHYTQSDALERYFKTMMWYGRMAFLLKGGPGGLISDYDAKIQTLQALLLANSLRNIHIGERTGLDTWDRLYTVTSFFVGLEDDLTPYDYLCALDQVFGTGFVLSDLMDSDNLFVLKTELAIFPSPKIYGGTGNIVLDGPITNESLNEVLDKTKGMHLMGRRFVPDSYMFQHIVYPEVGSYLGDPKKLPFTSGSDGMGGFYRAYIRGLDLMALLGSSEALDILTDEEDTNYLRYGLRFGEMKEEFDDLSKTDWNVNLYWSWLYSLRGLLQELPEGYPEFMRTQAWQRRQIHAALASWTQLRHDMILHSKQSYPPPPAGRLPTPPPGYVEPIPVFWGRLLSLTRMTSKGLDDLNVLTPESRLRLSRMEELLQQILDIVAKQLTNDALSSKDRKFFSELPSRLASVVKDVQGQWLVTTLVADVHTNPLEEKVVEEAVGKVDLIVVACPMSEGKAFLTIGPVLSYYEFKHPMNNRLTDEAWRLMLDSPNKPERPRWYVPLMRRGNNSSIIRQ